MNGRLETFEWFETPRMRWRAMGMTAYAWRLGLSVALWAFAAGVLALCGRVPLKPSFMLFPLAVGATGRLLAELVPGAVKLGGGRLILKRGFGRQELLLSRCSAIRFTSVKGSLLRMELEVHKTGNADRVRRVVIAARQKDEPAVRSMVEVSHHDLNDPRRQKT